MWPTKSTSSSEKKSPDLVTDSASGGPQTARTYGEYHEDQIQRCSKSSHMLSREDPSSPTSCGKGYSYESGRSDSGFISEANITSEQLTSSDDLSSKSRINYRDSGIQESYPSEEIHHSKHHSKDHMRLDSGVDIGLHDQFSQLDIKEFHLNDLSATSRVDHSSEPAPCKNIPAPVSPVKQQQLQEPSPGWELYFQQDEDGDTQLHIAIIQEFIEVVYSLIRMAPDPCLLDIPNDQHQTPLHLAVLTNTPRIVRALLVAGASPDSKDRYGNTALHLASERGAIECVKALLVPITVHESSGAGLRYSCTGAAASGLSALEERNYDGQLCVHLAAAGGHVDILRHLMWFGADINARDAKSGRTALHVAAESGRKDVADFLLIECKSSVNLDMTTYAGYTAYQLAYYTHPDMAREMVARGATQFVLEEDSEDSESDDDDEMYPYTRPAELAFKGMNGSKAIIA